MNLRVILKRSMSVSTRLPRLSLMPFDYLMGAICAVHILQDLLFRNSVIRFIGLFPLVADGHASR